MPRANYARVQALGKAPSGASKAGKDSEKTKEYSEISPKTATNFYAGLRVRPAVMPKCPTERSAGLC